MANIGIYGIFLVFLTTHICTVRPEDIVPRNMNMNVVDSTSPIPVTLNTQNWNDSYITGTSERYSDSIKVRTDYDLKCLVDHLCCWKCTVLYN